MSDDKPEESAAARRPSPNPASRARRIGGRPTPGSSPQPGPAPTPKSASTVTTATTPVSTTKRPAPPTDASTTDQPKRPRRRLPLRWLPAGVLGAAVIVLLVLLGIASHGVYWAKPDNSDAARTARQEQVLAAAKKCFAQINTYDYRKLTGLVAQDVQCTTGAFTADLTRALQTQIIPLAPKLKAVQTAQVNRAGIASVSSDGSQVVTLMYGQLSQTNSNTAQNTPRIDVVGAIVTMQNVKGKWLIAKVDTDVGNTVTQ